MIESRRLVIDHFAKVRGCPTYGWLKRLKENHAEDLEQLGILNVVVARMFNPYSNPHIGANMSQEKFFDATAMNVQSAYTKDVTGGYVFNSTPMDSYGMPATRVNLVESGVTSDGSPKLINDIEAGKHDELLSGMTNDDRMETMDALVTLSFSLWTSIPSQHPMLEPGASAKDQPKVNSNFYTLVADPVFDGVNISIPRKVVKKVSTRFEHILCGYFIGKRMAFPVVQYFARNNWDKHGLKRIMMNSKGFFFFKFDSQAGL
nr:zinc knuckle CX2CX4HX4C [Tanacetum cinerariifolium]